MESRGHAGIGEWLRRVVLGHRVYVIDQLEREVRDLRKAVDDRATARALIVEVLREDLRSAPDEIAAALMPTFEQQFAPRQRDVTSHSRRSLSWVSAALAAMLISLAVSTWRPQGAGVSQATEADPERQVAQAPAPHAVVLEQRNDGFGLGQSRLTDEELVREVRTRLANCPELAGAPVSFSVKEGWVWLRGESSSGGREAATRALEGLSAFVVNQVVVAPTSEVVAQR
jgi:hypothetical protein